jgi:hypothetical protein
MTPGLDWAEDRSMGSVRNWAAGSAIVGLFLLGSFVGFLGVIAARC